MFPSAGTQSSTLLTCQSLTSLVPGQVPSPIQGSDISTDQRPTASLVAASQLYKVKKTRSLIAWRQPSLTEQYSSSWPHQPELREGCHVLHTNAWCQTKGWWCHGETRAPRIGVSTAVKEVHLALWEMFCSLRQHLGREKWKRTIHIQIPSLLLQQSLQA